jgi:hypothetical protein
MGNSIQSKKLALILLGVLCAVVVLMFFLSRVGNMAPGPLEPITNDGDKTLNQQAAPVRTVEPISEKDYWWDVSGFSREEKDIWKKAGFTGKDGGGWAALFRSQGMSPEKAVREKARWTKTGAGFGPEEASAWYQAVGDSARAKEFKAQGLRPEDIEQEQ